MGCVGHGCSPANDDVSITLTSLIGNKGSPVSLLSKKIKPSLVACAMASIGLPLIFTVTKLGWQGRSRSHKS